MKTRDGRKVTITKIKENEYYPIRGKIHYFWLFTVDTAWTKDGKYFHDLESYHLDLEL